MGELVFVEWKRSDSWICCENYRSFEGFSCFVIHQWDWADFLWCSVTLFVQNLPFGIGNGWLCRGERSMLTCPFPAREKVAKQKEKVVENDPDTKRHTFFGKELQQQEQQQQQQQQQQPQKSAHHSEPMASLNQWTSKMSCHGFCMVRVLKQTVGVVGTAQWGFAVGLFVATAFLPAKQSIRTWERYKKMIIQLMKGLAG